MQTRLQLIKYACIFMLTKPKTFSFVVVRIKTFIRTEDTHKKKKKKFYRKFSWKIISLHFFHLIKKTFTFTRNIF